MDWWNLVADEQWILSKHYTPGRGGREVDKVLLHHTAGKLSIADCYRVWQTRPASAQYLATDEGRVGQFVWDRDTAWHAGNWYANQTSIGIEHADCQTDPYRLSEACLDAGAHLVAAVCRRYGLGRPEWGVNVFGHSDFAATECPASLAEGGSQHDEYMARAQAWYDEMTGAGEAPRAERTEDIVAEVRGAVYRVYDPRTGDHLLTASRDEANTLCNRGWSYEGVAFETGGDAVYRLYNPHTGEHMLTASVEERKALISAGWSYEGVAFYGTADGPEVFRLYNPSSGLHLFTASEGERDALASRGWAYEGVAFRAR